MGRLVRLLVTEWLIGSRKPEAELAPDGSSWILRHQGAYRVMVWCAGFLVGFLFASFLSVVLHNPKGSKHGRELTMCVASGILLPWMAYQIVRAHSQSMTLDDKGFTLGRPIIGPLRVEWTDIRSVRLSSYWKTLKIRAADAFVAIPVHMNGLGRFALYLQRYAPGVLTPSAREALPRLDPWPHQTPTSFTR